MASSRPAAPADQERLRAYWRENLRMIAVLLAIWLAAWALHPPLAKALNEIRVLTGFPLGYYLASQLSLVIFVAEIFFYAWWANNVLDPKYGFGDDHPEARR